MPKEQWEEEAISRFLAHLNSSRGHSFGITRRDVVVEKGRNFDYELTDSEGNYLAVEIFRLVDSEEELGQNKAWGEVITKLRDELTKRNVKGYYISTPPVFTYRRNSLESLVQRIADEIQAVIITDPREKFKSGDYHFHKIDGLEVVSFGYHSGAKSIDPEGTALAKFSQQLPRKNEQLEVDNREKILLVVNWAFFVDAKDAMRALARIDFNLYKNVDRIYFEASKEATFLVFDRKVLDAIRENVGVIQQLEVLLFQNLDCLLSDGKESAFEYIKILSEKKKNILWLSDDAIRENLIDYATLKIKEGDLDKVWWIIDALEDDPNPNKLGENDPDDFEGEFNYHNQIEKGQDTVVISTVRGKLCWLLQDLIGLNRPEYYTKIISIIQKYIDEPNLYIRSQVCVPLSALVMRLHAIKNQDNSPFEWEAEERVVVRNLVFKMLRDNAKYPRILQSLLHVYNYLRDLNEDEAEEVLGVFLNTDDKDVQHDSAFLLVYLALFRDKEWKNLPPFDSTGSRKTLRESIERGNSSLKTSVAWHLWKILKDKESPYEVIREYILLVFDGDCDSNILSDWMLIIEELIPVFPKDAVALFKKMVQKVKMEVERSSEMTHLWIGSTEEILPLLVNEPEEIVKIVTSLKDLWMRGFYIGDIPSIFEIFKEVNEAKKEYTKGELLKLYQEMKAVNPKLAEISWE